MSEYISRESVLALEDDFELTLPDDEIFFSYIPITDVEKLPAADVRPVVRGQWEEVEVIWLADIEDQPDAIATMFCPKCKRFANHIYHYGDPTYCMNYCPNCGADMRGGQNV